MDSFFAAESGGRFVTVWPAASPGAIGARDGYDVAVGDVDDEPCQACLGSGRPCNVTMYGDISARHAATILLTELGSPIGETLESVERRIVSWRTDWEAHRSAMR